jgi:2'-hydroxyisoflavone reductase
MTNPTVLIIGGGKFIGRHLVARLLSEQYKVAMLTRGITPHPFEGLVEWLKCDRDDVGAFDALLHRRAFDYVIDVINFNARHASHAVDFFFGRTSRYIHISSAAVYLLNRMRVNPLMETDAPADLGESPPVPGSMVEYGRHKRAAELEIEKAVVEKGFPAVILRPAVVSGKYDYTRRDLSYIMRVKDGGPILLPVERRGSHRHVNVSDLVDGIMLCLVLKEAIGKIYNITSHSILSMPQYLGLIARALDVKLEIMFVPYERLRGELGRGFSPFAYEMDFIQDIHRARCELGFRPARSEDWLGELARYYIEEIKSEPPEEYTRRRGKELALAGAVKGNET